jgi:hypothetical protein
MKRIAYILILLSLIACKSGYKRAKFDYNQSEKQIWIDSYKYEVFYGCIKEGIGNDSLRIILDNKDLFNKNSDMPFPTIDEARVHGKEIIMNMPKAYIKIDNDQEDLKHKNFISYNCLVYYASRDLDSIAKAEYKKYLKERNQD